MCQGADANVAEGVIMRKAAPPRSTPMDDMMPKDASKSEVQAWAKRIKVDPKEIHIRPMRSKWASCSSLGRLSFNADLLEQPTNFRKEVIVHELLHLKVPNHGKLFKALLKAYLG